MFNGRVAEITWAWQHDYDARILDVISRAQEQAVPRAELKTIHDLSLGAGKLIELSWGLELPDPAISGHLLGLLGEHNEAIAWYSQRVELDDEGCWILPLPAGYDDKNRARYPQVSNRQFGAHSELAHRFVIRRTLGATGLTRADHIDHQCRKHACSNIAHLMITSPGQNTTRANIARRSTRGQGRLF